MTKRIAYKRVLLKLSGEALMGENGYGIDNQAADQLAQKVKIFHDLGIQTACVVGGGNIFRGANARGMERANADYMGMLATVINALALQGALERADIDTRVQTAIEMPRVAEPFIRRRAIRHLEKGRVVIFAAGTGNPYFTTDTTAALRANEIQAEAILKATKVDGIYSADPMKDPNAKRYETISYAECLDQRLGVMDSTAFSMCQDNGMPIIVFNFNDEDAIRRIVYGDMGAGTVVS